MIFTKFARLSMISIFVQVCSIHSVQASLGMSKILTYMNPDDKLVQEDYMILSSFNAALYAEHTGTCFVTISKL